MEDLKPIVAKNLSELRKVNGFTQAELAERLNYSDKAVSKWERGESLPDIVVLKEMADLFGVTLDYLAHASHEEETHPSGLRRLRNHGFLTGMSVLLVWLVATTAFVTVEIVAGDSHLGWISFLWATPVSCIVWLIFNSIWFNRRRNFLIASILTWTLIGAVYVTLLLFEINWWELFLIGAPAQMLILLSSGLRYRRAAETTTTEEQP